MTIFHIREKLRAAVRKWRTGEPKACHKSWEENLNPFTATVNHPKESQESPTSGESASTEESQLGNPLPAATAVAANSTKNQKKDSISAETENHPETEQKCTSLPSSAPSSFASKCQFSRILSSRNCWAGCAPFSLVPSLVTSHILFPRSLLPPPSIT